MNKAMMKMMLDRESVCAGDDCFSHKVEFDVSEEITVAELFDFLRAKHYIPSISGNDVAWELRNSGEAIAVYLTKESIVTNGEASIQQIMSQSGNERFVLFYYSSPEHYLQGRRF